MNSNTTSSEDVNVVRFPDREKPAFSREEYVEAIHGWIQDRRNSLTRAELGKLDRFHRLDAHRKSYLIGVITYCRENPKVDATLAIYALVTFLSDNDKGVCTLSQAKMAGIVGRTRQTVSEAMKRLGCGEDGARLIEHQNGKAAASPIVPRIFAAEYNHLVWLTEAAAIAPKSVTCLEKPTGVNLSGDADRSSQPVGRSRQVTCREKPNDLSGVADTTSTNIILRERETRARDEKEVDGSSKIKALTTALAAAGFAVGAAVTPAAANVSQQIEMEILSAETQAKKSNPEGTRLPETWRLPLDWGQWAEYDCKRDREWVLQQAAKFKDYWLSVPDSKGFKKNWRSTWQNWCRNTLQREAKYAPRQFKNSQTPVKSWADREAETQKAALYREAEALETRGPVRPRCEP